MRIGCPFHESSFVVYDGIVLKLGRTGFGGDVGRILGVGRGLGDGIGLGVGVAVAVGVGVGWPPVKRRITVPIPPTAVPFSRSVKCTDMN